MKRYLLASLLLMGPMLGVDVQRDMTQSSDEVMVDCLNGLLFLNSWDDVRKNCPDDLYCVEARGVVLLQRNPEFLKSLQEKYIGRPLTQRVIWNLKNEIADFYRSINQPLVVITVPRQDICNGVLQIVVEEARLGQVYVQGNCYFPSRWFSSAMRINPGDPIDGQTIFEDVAWLNLNPFRRTDAIYKPGAKPNLVDIELVTVDRWPYRVYAGGDNTGTISTNRNRLFFGFNFGKSVLKDGQISYQFTFAPNWNLYYSHTASARLPLPWRHVWVLWGGYASVEPHTDRPGMKNRGISWQVDTRYRFPFFSGTSLMQTFVVGYDFKESNNDLLFNGDKIFSAYADINQFMIGYELGYRKNDLRISLTAELYGSPGDITHGDKSKFYKQLRFDANNTYAYLKVAHSLGKKFKYGWWSYDLTGQASTANLLPSEQATLTGYNAVRGFEERILNLDNALIGNFAYETPHWSFAKAFGWCKKWDEFYFLGFFDCAVGADHLTPAGETMVKSLGSIGPGARWQIDRYFTARFDYGFQLWHHGFENPSHSRYNFGMILSY
ncbi:MAG: hypothetical protein K1X28_03735 [Parachlamydiales bacterium]|nr:hypothetical protein [Parachlamydiales bacterium]